ncbi:hypothetical protein FOH24_01085 [Acetobacter tropicalis]|uniref:Phosphate starvation-inducible protein PsiF n=1 Tax=Acetobacter tropicalis TaxID=104102 RepID=A0A0C9LRZ8_9PROT|nr:hypothetical protein [Acetobacter tropicalis]KAA8390781.1 hypothetical protein FOH22_01515 [Acetobacter tropicalis]KAA8393384.1 hypothetical protein FOH24_01085 [Acetobacter tropicalis]KXV47034.1 hypothetical protein AD944_12330 [Acetobacter tropicalis]KXV59668.1 hypothetical protein AD947_03520 [Acetobacter tropicalis]MBC9007155.1 hypothetical protein [Acetobacter tropicalis]
MFILKRKAFHKFCLALSATAAVGLMAPAHAETTREKQTAACKGDAIKLCGLFIPNEEKITACMQKKKDKLSPKCRAFFDKDPAKKKSGTKK